MMQLPLRRIALLLLPALFCTGCGVFGASRPASELHGGVYQAILPAADAVARKVSLILERDGSCLLATTMLGREPLAASIEEGTWTVQNRGILVLLKAAGRQDPKRIRFGLEGNELVSTEWAREHYGSTSLRLKRR